MGHTGTGPHGSSNDMKWNKEEPVNTITKQQAEITTLRERLAAWESGTVYATKTTQVSIETIGGSMTMAGWLWTDAVAERDRMKQQLADANAANQSLQIQLQQAFDFL